MKILLDIEDSWADDFMEVLDDLPYVKNRKIKKSKKKSRLYREMEEAVKELKDIYAGKKKGRDAFEFLNEL